MFDTIRIGKKIAERRKQKNLTQMELADAMGVSFQAVSNWERGNSMPDISKLAELSEILGTTIDELLGKKNFVVEQLARDENADLTQADSAEMAEAASIAKPRTVEKMAEECDDENVAVLLPFLSEECLLELANSALEKGKDVSAFLPFLDEEDVDGLLERALADGRTDIGPFLPFASEEKLAEAASQCRQRGKDCSAFLPFLDERGLKALAQEAVEAGGLKALTAFLPFLEEKDVEALTALFIRKDGAAKQ